MQLQSMQLSQLPLAKQDKIVSKILRSTILVYSFNIPSNYQ
jgi:hypothetical protein